MKIEDIVESLNKHIELKREEKGIKTTGHLVLQKEVMPNSSFKVYKVYRYTLWFVKRGKSYRVISLQETTRVPTGMEEAVVNKIEIMLIEVILNWIGSSFYQQVIEGDYNGISENTNE